jgi:hypothetical protein
MIHKFKAGKYRSCQDFHCLLVYAPEYPCLVLTKIYKDTGNWEVEPCVAAVNERKIANALIDRR